MASYWHVLKSTRRFGADAVQAIWDEERAAGIVTAGYGNAPDGPGRAKLQRYRPGDRVVVYTPGFGAVAVGEVVGREPGYTQKPSRHEHAHHLQVRWEAVRHRLSDAVPAAAIRAAGGYVPRTLAMRLPDDVAARIEAALRAVA